MFFIFSDVFQSEFWMQSQGLRSAKLRDLASSLSEVILAAKADSTNEKYSRAWRAWKNWERENLGSNTFPVSPFVFCLYLRDKFESCRSPAPIEVAVYGVRWAHNLAGVASPTDHLLVKQFLEGSRRLLGKPVCGKKPLELEVITAIGNKLNVAGASLSDIRTCFIFFIGFSGLLRCDEIVRLTRGDVSIYPSYMSINCRRRKNDQYSRGHNVLIERSGKVTCPVAITEKLFVQLPVNADQPLLCRLKANGTALSQAISYTRVREIFRETISGFVDDPSSYGTHILRKGGACAAHNAGVSGDSLDKFAGWKSDRSKLSYISDKNEKLKVSRAINL